MRCVVYRGVGGREVVAVEERPDPQPGRFEVVIAPPFAGINPADVLQREGKHPVPPGWPMDIPGLEVAGPVVAAGDAVTASTRSATAPSGWSAAAGSATRVVANERELAAVPDALDAATAAAAPQSFLTAFDAIVMQAGLGGGRPAARERRQRRRRQGRRADRRTRWARGWSRTCARRNCGHESRRWVPRRCPPTRRSRGCASWAGPT